ncbi:unnamed protein product [Phaedon cochleariae]|uniref:phosphoserine transaminase n=1 Tax=Phaedon cochleariae TaxID=80249 RepID=A0A9P0D920_PHACE|nr:unnamed protein product [Phaedon cochleariae]
MSSEINVINFGAGPAKLPKEVLLDVQKEFLSYQNEGMGIVEISHRSEEYAKINSSAQSTLRELLNVPVNYKILFMHGGGQGAFSAIPMNLMSRTGKADYLVTGTWSSVAANEAKKYGQVNIVNARIPGGIPDPKTWKLNSDASYVFYCDNDTIDGVEFPFIPETEDIPLVADMSSNLLTKKLDVSKFGVIFAASQKNLGPASVAVLIVREDLLGNATEYCPSILDFTILNKMDSILNTPPIFSIYVMDKVFRWIRKSGGLTVMETLSEQKSSLVYNTLELHNTFYFSPVGKNARSRINIPFRIGKSNGDEELENQFLREAEERNMLQLKGHHLVGGIRVSLFNSITVQEVNRLIDFMIDFQKRNAA